MLYGFDLATILGLSRAKDTCAVGSVHNATSSEYGRCTSNPNQFQINDVMLVDAREGVDETPAANVVEASRGGGAHKRLRSFAVQRWQRSYTQLETATAVHDCCSWNRHGMPARRIGQHDAKISPQGTSRV